MTMLQVKESAYFGNIHMQKKKSDSAFTCKPEHVKHSHKIKWDTLINLWRSQHLLIQADSTGKNGPYRGFQIVLTKQDNNM